MLEMVLKCIGCAIGAYLLGSISPSLIISDMILKDDVRKYGSGNAGSTNMLRAFGWQLGIITFVVDILKGVLAAYLSQLIAGQYAMIAASLAVVLGHNFPIYFKFKGGKGVATILGVLLVWQLLPTLAILVVCGIVALVTKIISIASILGAVISMIAVFVFYPDQVIQQITIVILCVVLIISHKQNISRLIKKEENKITNLKSYKRDPQKKSSNQISKKNQQSEM